MEQIVRKFSNKFKNSGVGFFYYAGHWVEVDGNNYLIPIDADIPDKDEVKYKLTRATGRATIVASSTRRV